MKKHVKDQWVKALRSGEYEQGTGQLHRVNGKPEFCCLGVLCDLFQQSQKQANQTIAPVSKDRRLIRYDGEAWALPAMVMEWSGIAERCGRLPGDAKHLAYQNDSGASFKQIATIIDKHWREL